MKIARKVTGEHRQLLCLLDDRYAGINIFPPIQGSCEADPNVRGELEALFPKTKGEGGCNCGCRVA